MIHVPLPVLHSISSANIQLYLCLIFERTLNDHVFPNRIWDQPCSQKIVISSHRRTYLSAPAALRSSIACRNRNYDHRVCPPMSHIAPLIFCSPVLAPRHPAKNAECYQGSRPLRPLEMSSNAVLAAPYAREQGHLRIWPPEHRYR